jgi:peptidoglycan/LPS O-acetylase OafA/YrhL
MQTIATPEVGSRPAVQFAGLDLLRCFAALSIVIYHSTLGLEQVVHIPRAVAKELHNLPVGVDFFFLISGFLITYLLLAEKGRTATISLTRFYVRRALRIFPLYFLIVGLAWWLHHDAMPEIDFSPYLYFWGNFWMIATDKWTAATLNPLWSLCIEEQFYLVIPLLVLLLPVRRLPWLFGGIIVLSVVFRLYATVSLPSNWMSIYCHTLSRCDILALGGWLAWRHYTQPIQLQLPSWTLPAALFMLVLLLSIIDCSDFSTVHLATLKKYLYMGPLLFIFSYVVFSSGSSSSSSALTRLEPALNYLGKISYGLYMYHSPIIYLLDDNYSLNEEHPYGRLLIIFLLTIAVAAVSYELFEKQILRLKKRFEVVRTVRA